MLLVVKAIFVGNEPNAQAKSKTPFRHAKCAERLQNWIDYLVGDADYWILNQCDIDEQTFIELSNAAYRANVPVVALGNNASKKLGSRVRHFKLPHPSGLNRQLNDKVKLWLKLLECKNYLG